ncbi:metallophosphoesterase family protein [Tenuibacillus multivorans]|uniref:DNA repair exonuclease SbcCD nuclease subunit n=1 Tax=Tenuibacillus multivorans TaxID=237069 RepID=A0A1H0GAV3_9BACI|nr:DNA repair exonuclease [Tenuibacillus multivorans]GEL78801.1 DNA repair exonuclease [Tenuibacillus multivorans]SDO03948.1 DNA repair exonuclease SbcCD nuclease subunit [Tenuibacillus multivorans]
MRDLKSIRFLHAADLHLDSPYKGMKNLPNSIFKDIKESTLMAFNRLINLAIDQRVDFVLFVGDLFDQYSASIKSRMVLKHGLEKLKEHNIQVYISFGNHDYRMQEKADLSFPSNTFVFTSQSVSHFVCEKHGKPLAQISGFSYEERDVTEKMVGQYDAKDNSLYHIAMLHGSLQSNNDHDTYAPFLLNDLKGKQVDYWALGHIHQRQIILDRPYAVYPGNIQGRHIKETGKKGCYIVDLSPHQTQLSFFPLQEVMFLQKELELEGVNTIDDFLHALEQYKDLLKTEHEKIFLRLTIQLDETSQIDVNVEQIEEILNMINGPEEEEKYWVWIQDMKVNEDISYNRVELKDSNQFAGEVIKTIDEGKEVEKYIQDLLRHHTFKKHIHWNLDEVKDEIKEEAERLIIKELMKNGDDHAD